jgi:hypothetical protein
MDLSHLAGIVLAWDLIPVSSITNILRSPEEFLS